MSKYIFFIVFILIILLSFHEPKSMVGGTGIKEDIDLFMYKRVLDQAVIGN